MKTTLVFVVATALALAVIGCKSGDDTTAASTNGTGGAAMPNLSGNGTATPPAGPKGNAPPAAGQAPQVQLNTGADTTKYTPGTSIKTGK